MMSISRIFGWILLLAIIAPACALATPLLKTEIISGDPCRSGQDFIVQVTLSNNDETVVTSSFRLLYPEDDYEFRSERTGPEHDGEVNTNELLDHSDGKARLNVTVFPSLDFPVELFEEGVLCELTFRVKRDLPDGSDIEMDLGQVDTFDDRLETIEDFSLTSPIECDLSTPTPTPSPSPTPSLTPTPSPTASPSATPSATPSVTVSVTPMVTTTPTITVTPTVTTTPTPSPTPDPSVIYSNSFDNTGDAWEEVRAGVSSFDDPTFDATGGSLKLSPNGSSSCFGFYRSPRIFVDGGSTIEILWTVRSTTDSADCPQFRMRVNETGFRNSNFMAIESTSGGIAPGTEPVQYKQTYHVPSVSARVELAFDILSFNPLDDVDATIELMDVTVRTVE